jgi:site-specific recombinase XerD
MKKKMQLTQREFDQFEDYLRHDEREESTIEAYLRSLTRFAEWVDGRAVTKELAMEWKTALSESGYRPISVNAMLAAVNKFFTCMGREDCKVKYLKLQRQMFRKSEKDLSKEEYQRLVQAAHERGDLRMELILETICATGIRVGELKYITLETVRAGVAEIALKGKIRTILLPHRLCRKLQKYAKQQKIATGKLFLTQDGLPVSRQSIWTRMKALCEAAGVERTKVFPHNLRSLFARSFYGSCHDVVRLADVLGHSSIETTRIYLMSTGKEYLRQLDKLGLVQ